MSSHGDSTKTILITLAANFGIAVTKAGAAAYTGSGAMVAEAIHSFADCGNQALLLWGMRQAKQPPTADFPMGFGKAVYFWSFIVAILLFSVGGMFSVYEGVHRLAHPEPLDSPIVGIVVIFISLALEGGSMWAALADINRARGGRSWYRWFRETRQAELLIVVGENGAALAGLVIALVFLGLAMVTGNPLWDSLGSIAVGALLVLVASFISVEVKALLVGQSAEAPVRDGISRLVAAQPGVAEVLENLTLHFGGDVMVALKARMHDQDSVDTLCRVINAAEAAVKREYPQVKWVFFEPDIRK